MLYGALSYRTFSQDTGNFTDLFHERESIDIRVHKEKTTDPTKFIGRDFNETYQLNKLWLMRVLRFFLFYSIGIIFFSQMEGWDFRTCVYFITQTISTVGYGNITPTTVSSKMFCVFYIFAGILLVFSVIGDVTSLLVDIMKQKYERPVKRKKHQIIVRNALNCIMWIFILFSIILFGSLVFYYNENFSFSDAFYFTAVTASSVGYGDIGLTKNSSIWFNIFYILISVSATATALEKVASFKRHIDEAELDQLLYGVELNDNLLQAIKPEKKPKVSQSDYILHMLQLEGKLSFNKDLKKWVQRFQEFDLDRDGYLTFNDVFGYQKLFKKTNVNLIKQSRPHRKRSIFERITKEAKEVVLETLKLKSPEEAIIKDIQISPPRSSIVSLRKSMNVSKKMANIIQNSVLEEFSGVENKSPFHEDFNESSYDIESGSVDRDSNTIELSEILKN